MQIGEHQILNKNYDELLQFAKENSDKYINADPFPSIYFDNFFNENILISYKDLGTFLVSIYETTSRIIFESAQEFEILCI